jgi:hypothetical protein
MIIVVLILSSIGVDKKQHIPVLSVIRPVFYAKIMARRPGKSRPQGTSYIRNYLLLKSKFMADFAAFLS